MKVVACSRSVHSVQQHHLYQERQRAPRGQRAAPDPRVPRGMHPGLPSVKHRDETSLSGVHDSLAAEPHKVTKPLMTFVNGQVLS